MNDSPDEILAKVSASHGRRILGIGMFWCLAFVVLTVAITTAPGLGWQLFLLVVGGVSLWFSERIRRATALTLELTEHELRDSSGAVLARTQDILALDRGVFAFKPSNGFLIKLAKSKSRVWRPGLYWRVGNRIGIGGMTPGYQAKFMAEIISAMIVQRGE